jgi:hypothetical protein
MRPGGGLADEQLLRCLYDGFLLPVFRQGIPTRTHRILFRSQIAQLGLWRFLGRFLCPLGCALATLFVSLGVHLGI